MDLYAQIDQMVTAFQIKSGLRCVSSCGACCATANVHVTILEMLPVAHEILKSGEVTVWLERLTAQPESGRCILFCPDPPAEAAGHCGFYQYRPALCRLFGFAAVRGRTGAKALSICKYIQQTDPQNAATAALLAEKAPCFVNYSTRIYALDALLGTCLMPINDALHQAIDRIGLRLSFSYGQALHDNTAA